MTLAGPMSPCINICSLDEQGVCRGCYRSLEEIAQWSTMSPARQFEVLRQSEQRRRESSAPVSG